MTVLADIEQLALLFQRLGHVLNMRTRPAMNILSRDKQIEILLRGSASALRRA